jgi:purine-cytosine permease-like protein
MVDLLIAHSEEYSEEDRDDLKSASLTAELIREAIEIENKLVDEGKLRPEDKKIEVPTPLPGKLANNACGLAGLICVIIAGWTTANPTIYRAGLAFQAITPKTSRFVVTLVTGGVATVAGIFPAIAMKLLGFVALYGMILMPMGAVIFVDFWLIKKFGLKSNYAELSRKSFNWAAGLTWFLTFGTCVLLVKFSALVDWLIGYGILTESEQLTWVKETFTVQIFFVSLPGWFVAAGLYVLLSKLYQNKMHARATGEMVEWQR